MRGMLKRMQSGNKIYHETETQQPCQESNPEAKLVLDIYRDYIKVQKYLPQKESIFSGMLIDCYKHYMQNKVKSYKWINSFLPISSIFHVYNFQCHYP